MSRQLQRPRGARGATAAAAVPRAFAFAVLALVLSAPPVPAADAAARAVPAGIARQLQALASADSATQRAAIAALAASGDRQVIPALAALRDEDLYLWTRPDGARVVVIARQQSVRAGHTVYLLQQAYGGAPVRLADGSAAAEPLEGLQEISVDRQARAAVPPALQELQLFDPSPQARKEAAKALADRGDVAALPALTRALAAERNRSAHVAIEEAYYLLELSDPADTQKLSAVKQLGALRSIDAAPRLEDLAKTAGPQLQAAIAEALGRIRAWERLTQVAYAVFSGLSLGSILMLMSLGLAIIFGVMGVINMAHGELMMIGAYATFLTQNWFQAHLPPAAFEYYFLAAIPVSFVAAAAAGLVLERWVIRYLYGRTLETLLATWGVSLILIQLARFWFGDLTSVVAPRWLSGGLEVVNGLQLPYNRLFIIGFTLLCVVGVYVLLLRTAVGLRIRAVTQNRAMSAAMGIATRRVDAWTFALGAGLAGMAGCALTLIGNVEPDMGQNYIVDAFIVVVAGGVGKLAGTVVAALGIGWMNTLFELVTNSAVMGKVLILLIVILFLQRRPSGLFPPTGRSVEY